MAEPLPAVTVITPTYNRADLLAETIESVLAQDYPRLEYLVVDDGSTDRTPELVRRYQERIRYLRHANVGEAATVNRGFDEATGELIAVVNSDDPVRPGFVATMAAALAEDRAAVVAYPNWELIDPEGRVLAVRRPPPHDFHLMVAANWCYVGPGAMLRRRLLDRIGGRNPAFRRVGDLEFWLRAGLCGPFRHVDHTLATWRTHPDSISIGDANPATVAEFVRVIEHFFATPDLPHDIAALRDQALAMAYHIAALKSQWHDRRRARRLLARSLLLDPTLRSRHPSHPRSLSLALRILLLPRWLDRRLLDWWLRRRHGGGATLPRQDATGG